MYSLVQYDNLEYTILPSKRVKVIQGSNCVVKYSSGAKYNAELIESSDSVDSLEKLKKKLEHPVPTITASTPNSSLEVPYVQLSNISSLNLTYSLNSISDAPSGLTDELCNLGPNWPDKDLTFSIQDASTEDPLIIDEELSDKDLRNGNNDTSEKSINDNMKDMTDEHSGDNTEEVSKEYSPHDFGDGFQKKSNQNNKNDDLSKIHGIKIISDIILSKESVCHVEKIKPFSKSDLNHLNNESDNLNSLNDTEQETNNVDEIVEQNTDSHNSEESKSSVNETFTENKSVSTINTEDDSSYRPEQSTNDALPEKSTSINDSSIKEMSSVFEESCLVNVQELEVPVKKSKEGKSKKHFCPFCKTLQTKFARHLLLKHRKEEEVRKFIYLPHKNKERMQIINAIRKKGDFMHNTKPELNSGILIVSRQKQVKSRNVAEDYICCKSCNGFFAKQTIRFHTARCDSKRKKGERHILSSGRRLTGFIHSAAKNNLRRDIFPVLTDDDVVRSIKYDELIIMYGNKLCDRYTLRHQHDYVRTQLRMLGRIKIEMMKLDKSLHEFKDIFKPQHFDKCIECLRKLADWNESSGTFRVPFNAQFISTLIKKSAQKLRTECIKCQDHERKKLVDDFLLLWEEEIPTLIHKKAHNDQMDQRRGKKVILPSKEDIKLLYDYLKNECCHCLKILESEFDMNAYQLLIKCTLILIQIFNRRRAGEIERLTINNYVNKEVLNDNIDKELYEKLSDATKEFAKQFTRLAIRGKLDRTVPVLLSPLTEKCIQKILEFRKEAGVSDQNEYIFCSLNKSKLSKPYLRACTLLRRFSNECGAVMPSTLRGTQLRKHVATYTSMLNIEECRVDRLANFMGHHKDIHKSIYRVPVPVAEITDVSKLLMAAIGDDQENDDDKGSDDNQNSDSSSDDEDSNSQRKAGKSKSNILPSTSDKDDTSVMPRNDSKPIRHHELLSKKNIIRTKWSDLEKQAITEHFGDLKKLTKLPSMKECEKVTKKFQVLKNRTPLHIFSYINNQRRRL